MDKMTKSFEITSICRKDIMNAGYTKDQVEKITDREMEKIASRMADAYCSNGLWIDLPIMTDYVVFDK